MNTVQSSPRLLAKGVTLVALAAAAFWLFCLYGRWLKDMSYVSLKFLWNALGPLTLFTDFMNPVFANLYVFAGSYVVVLVLIGTAIRFARPRRLTRVSLFAGFLLGLAFPLLLPSLYGQYQLPAQAAPGYDMRWLTPPPDAFSHAFRNAQRAHEQEGCRYTLAGWSADNVLYYASDCPMARSYYRSRTAKG